MKKRISIIMTALIIVLAIAVPALLSYAQSGSGTVTVLPNQGMTQAETNRHRSGDYSYVDVRAHSVYPPGDYVIELYFHCKTRLYKSNTNAQSISEVFTLTEGAPFTHVSLNEGTLSTTYYDICFAGNTNDVVVVSYSYDGK